MSLRVGALILGTLGFTLLPSYAAGAELNAGEGDAAARLSALRQRFESLTSETATCRAIFEEEIARGVPGSWSVEEAADALSWTASVFAESAPLPGGANQGRGSPDAELLLRGAVGLVPYSSTGFVQRWLLERLTVLESVREEARVAFCWAACDYAENVWLRAKSAADLAPAVAALGEARAHKRREFSYVSQELGRNRLRHAGARATDPLWPPEPVLALVDFWSVLANPEPLLLPDPGDSPGQFSQWRGILRQLRWLEHRFVARAGVATRFADLERAIALSLHASYRERDRLILVDAPIAEAKAAYVRFGGVTAPLRAAGPPRDRALFARPAGMPDYRDVVRGSGGAMAPPVDQAEGSGYPEWLAWRGAKERGEVGEIAATATRLHAALPRLPLNVRQHLEKRLSAAASATEAPAVQAGAPRNNPVEHLLATLQLLASRKPHGTASDGIAKEWRGIDAASSLASPESRTDLDWQHLASEPEGQTLFALRDAAALHTVAGIIRESPIDAVPAGTTLATLLTEALEKSIRKSDIASAAQLLALDRACCALTPETHADYARGLVWLTQRASETELQRVFSAREIIQQTASRALAVAAVGVIKQSAPGRRP